MKKVFFPFLAIAAVVTTGILASCNSDSETSSSGVTTLTLSDSIEANNAAIGIYDGCVYLPDGDSIASVTWTIKAVSRKESSLTMDNFPASAVAALITSDDVSTAATILAASEPQQLSFDVVPALMLTSSSSLIYEYSVTPTASLQYEVTTDEATHSVTIAFGKYYEDEDGYYYYPMAIMQDDVFHGNIILGSVTVDNVVYELNAAYGFKAAKSGSATDDIISTTE